MHEVDYKLITVIARDTVLIYHTQDPRFDPQHCKNNNQKTQTDRPTDRQTDKTGYTLTWNS
jgi:hypothetical protein